MYMMFQNFGKTSASAELVVQVNRFGVFGSGFHVFSDSLYFESGTVDRSMPLSIFMKVAL